MEGGRAMSLSFNITLQTEPTGQNEFDLEIIFLFPWAIAFNDIGIFGFLSMMFFLLVLTIGFVYEWMKGALDWN